jgi:hypothetical protein
MITFVSCLISQHTFWKIFGGEGGWKGVWRPIEGGVRPHIAQWTNKHLVQTSFVASDGHGEPAPTSAPWRMNGKWSGNSFLLGFSSLA